MSPDANIAIGIPVCGSASLVERTIAVLRCTAPQARILLLGDGATVQLDGLAACGDYPSHLPANHSGGNAACFNLLVHSISAEIYILFEAGAVPAPGWLSRLLTTFIRVPRCGLTGPSTDRCWNEQAVVSPGGALPANAARDIVSTARAIERRFGSGLRTLRPLHSLADFCYAVRREVIETIGPADEDYSRGACWEMDYNIRAHRAGFLGVWTCGAYVERGPAPVDPDAAAQLQAGRHRYQDKFCGGHLRGRKSDYRDHCRGDACPNFAPPDLIQIRVGRQHDLAAPAPSASEPCVAPPLHADALSLVSCIMPTCNRRAFIPAALACFKAQDYPNLELIIVDDGSDPISDLLPADPRIRYFRLEGKHNTGAKRNLACEQARGSFIAHWDDDDWYAPTRIRAQIEAMRGAHSQVCGTTTMYYLHQEKNLAFRYTYRGGGRAWLGALLYTRSAWERSRFESIQVGEDVRFLTRIPVSDRLDLQDPALTIGTIHSGNTSPKVTSGSYWSPEPPEKIRALMQPPAPALAPSLPQPLVSCIMPTHNRRAFIGLTFACFHAQTWPSKELIVVDDGTDEVGDLLENRPGVRYARVAGRMTVGAKRNLACELAGGDLIAHWDDDDWYAPDRLKRQLEPLCADTHDITGLVGGSMLQMPSGEFWTTTPELHRKMFVGDIHGGTLVYRRVLWQSGNRYPEVNLAEDAAFIRRAIAARQRIARIENDGLFVYLRHHRNTWKFASGRFLDPSAWRKTEAPAGFSQQLLAMYTAASSGIPAPPPEALLAKQSAFCVATG